MPTPQLTRREVLGEFYLAVGQACRNLNIKLNQGYSPAVEEHYETRQDEPKTFRELVSRRRERSNNLRMFEDDAMIYLILKGGNLIYNGTCVMMGWVGFTEKEIVGKVQNAYTTSSRAQIFQTNGDFRFFGGAAGYLECSDRLKGEAIELYKEAALQHAASKGTFHALPVLMDKIAERFEKYFAITQEAFSNSAIKPLSKKDRINLLINLLKQEQDKDKQEEIKIELTALVST